MNLRDFSAKKRPKEDHFSEKVFFKDQSLQKKTELGALCDYICLYFSSWLAIYYDFSTSKDKSLCQEAFQNQKTLKIGTLSQGGYRQIINMSQPLF